MIKRILLKIFGRERIEFLRSKPFFAHGKYRSIIQDIEKYSKVISSNYGSDADLSLLLVRKFGHILDKGLHRTDAEKGHSKGIAAELAKNISIAEKFHSKDETLLWAKSKLELYNKLQAEGNIVSLEEFPDSQIPDFNSFEKLLKKRRSNRLFQTKTVENELLEKLASTVNWASSSCNKQPIMLFATTGPDLAKSCLKCCKGGTGFGDFIPAFVSFTADMRGYYLPDEAYLPAIDVSLGAQNFFLSTETFGLSACGLTWAQKDENDESELRRLLDIPNEYQIIFNAVIGFPMKNYITPIRKDLINTLRIKQ